MKQRGFGRETFTSACYTLIRYTNGSTMNEYVVCQGDATLLYKYGIMSSTTNRWHTNIKWTAKW